MAGIRHHDLPRFLLKGFASRIDREKVFTWVYRQGAKPFEASTRHINVSKHFYGRAGEINADPAITELEASFSHLVDELRKVQEQVAISDPLIPEFITHLTIRTKHLRDSFRESSEFLFQKIDEYYSDFNNVTAQFQNNPGLLKDAVQKAFRDVSLSPYQMNEILALIRPKVPAFFEQKKPELQLMLRMLMTGLRSAVPSMVREGHIRSLLKTSVPEPRAEDYRALRWFICISTHPLVLGDCGCLFEVESTRQFKSINFDDKIRNIFLPISSNRMLVGTPNQMVHTIDAVLLNNAVVKCSRETFIASEPPPRFDDLIPLIGQDSDIITKEEIESIVADWKSESNGK